MEASPLSPPHSPDRKIKINVNSAFRSCDNGDLIITCNNKRMANRIVPLELRHLGVALENSDGTYSIHMSGIKNSIKILTRIGTILKNEFDVASIQEAAEQKIKLESMQEEKEVRRRSSSTASYTAGEEAHKSFAETVESRGRFKI